MNPSMRVGNRLLLLRDGLCNLREAILLYTEVPLSLIMPLTHVKVSILIWLVDSRLVTTW